MYTAYTQSLYETHTMITIKRTALPTNRNILYYNNAESFVTQLIAIMKVDLSIIKYRIVKNKIRFLEKSAVPIFRVIVPVTIV